MITWRDVSHEPNKSSFGGRQRTSCDTKAGHEVICDRPDSGFPSQWRPICCDEPIEGNKNNESDIEPVDMLVPIRSGDRLIGDVRLLRIVFLVTIWLRWLCHA